MQVVVVLWLKELFMELMVLLGTVSVADGVAVGNVGVIELCY